MDDDDKAEIPISDWMAYDGDQAALVREYLPDRKKFERVSVSLDDWIESTDEERIKHRKFAERIYRMENKETG